MISYSPTPPEKNQRPDRLPWVIAKANGDICENVSRQFFLALGLAVEQHRGLAAHDLSITGKIECKNDLMATKTGNCAVEVSYRGRPSGILASKTSGWAILVGDLLHLMPTSKLKALIDTGRYRRVPGGEGAVVALIPVPEIRAISKCARIGKGDL